MGGEQKLIEEKDDTDDDFEASFKIPDTTSALKGLTDALQANHQLQEQKEAEEEKAAPDKKKKRQEQRRGGVICCCMREGCGIGPMLERAA